MSEERKKILQMLAEGKITVEEANELLNALNEGQERQSVSREAHFLRIKVWEDGKEKVNVNIPLSLAKMFMKFIPTEAKLQMESHDIDLNAIIRDIQNGAPAGKLVEIVDDGDRVEIYLD
ncbi:hypothetical protein BBF96_01720 [Anoxybacter fermentans]|uniref:YvlB/LiaX N-terminal domain-containing protein n=1 Tax=Anoxybacter fermentans TaxID=1323375 RepID=A0A3Q9HNS9_9FIRM|nr:hypothetical protein [Anoxybacter fermentans]AZR72225.1 hypothetical protein BBF96_01720 [Anoxybacter fermentans]